MRVAVVQAGRGRDQFIQACIREIWWAYAVNNITLSVVHTPEEQLTDSTDDLSWYHLVGLFKDCIHQLRHHGVHIIPVSHTLFKLSPYL